jgi:hypothetical protein
LVNLYELPSFDPFSAIRIFDPDGPQAAAYRALLQKFLEK